MGFGGVLSSSELRERIAGDPPLIDGYGDLEEQIQPNGFDLRLQEIKAYSGPGTITADNAGRVLPELTDIAFRPDGFALLPPGAYHITYAEIVNLPKDLMAFGRPRSSLTRCGVTIHTAVWDAGYSGRSTSMLVVENPAGFRLQQWARVAQLVFLTLSLADEFGYSGIYQGENLRP